MIVALPHAALWRDVQVEHHGESSDVFRFFAYVS